MIVKTSHIAVAVFVALTLISFIRVPVASAANDGSFNTPGSFRGSLTPYVYQEKTTGYGATDFGSTKDASFNVPGSFRGPLAASSFIITEEHPTGYGAVDTGHVRDGSFNRPVSHR